MLRSPVLFNDSLKYGKLELIDTRNNQDTRHETTHGNIYNSDMLMVSDDKGNNMKRYANNMEIMISNRELGRMSIKLRQPLPTDNLILKLYQVELNM